MGTKYDLNHSDTANFNYQMGTELYNAHADLTNVTTWGKTVNLVDGSMAEGTDAHTVKTTAAIKYMINGSVYAKATTDNIAMTAASAQSSSSYCLYLLSINASGTVTTTQGTEASAVTTLVPPDCPSSEAPIALLQVQTGSGTTFTSGTTDLGASGITDTFYDLVGVDAGAFQSSPVTMTATA